jgi:hypothetical protein
MLEQLHGCHDASKQHITFVNITMIPSENVHEKPHSIPIQQRINNNISNSNGFLSAQQLDDCQQE